MRFFILFLCLLAAPAFAQSPGLGGDSKLPIDISADSSLEWDQDARTYTARGNAVATRGDFSIYADTLTAYDRDRADGKGTEVWKLGAEGNVKIVSNKDGKVSEIYGDHGVYEIDRDVAVLTGENLRMINGNDTITATERFEYWNADKLAVAVGNAEAVRSGDDKGKAEERRVKADNMTAVFQPDAKGELQIDRVEAEGNVKIITAENVATSTKAVYDMTNNKAVLTGNVNLTHGKSQLAGDKAEVDFDTNQSRLLAGNGKKGRVHGLIYPKGTPGLDAGKKAAQ